MNRMKPNICVIACYLSGFVHQPKLLARSNTAPRSFAKKINASEILVSLPRRMNLMRGLPRTQVTFTKSIPGLRPAGQPSAVPIRSRRIGLARPRERNQRGRYRSCASRQLLPALPYLLPSMAVACARDISTSLYVNAARSPQGAWMCESGLLAISGAFVQLARQKNASLKHALTFP